MGKKVGASRPSKPAITAKSAIQRPSSRKKRVKTEPQENGAPKKKGRRFRSGTKSLRDIKRLQKTSDSCFTKLGFRRLIDECKEKVQRDYGYPGLRISDSATNAIINASENFVIGRTRAACKIAYGSGCVILKPNHLQLASEIQDAGLTHI